MTISQRIFSVMEEKKIKQKDLAFSVGISTSAISDWKKRNTNPAAENISAIADFLGVSLDFLITGKEKSSSANALSADEQELIDKYKELENEDKIRVKERAETLLEIRREENNKKECLSWINDNRTRKIEYYSLPASAGTGAFLDNNDKEEIEIPLTPTTKRADFAIRVRGDSMEPMFLDGDIVLVKKSDGIDVDEIGIFIVNGNGFIKMYQGDRLCSLNSKYDDIIFNDCTEIICTGKVIGKLNYKEI